MAQKMLIRNKPVTTNRGLESLESLARNCRIHLRKRGVRPKPAYAAVATINAAINALAKAFAEQGIKDGVQVNSVSPGAVMTGRRRAFFEKWAPAHNLTVEEAIKKFPEQAGIMRLGKPEEIGDLMSYLVSPAAKWMTGAAAHSEFGGSGLRMFMDRL